MPSCASCWTSSACAGLVFAVIVPAGLATCAESLTLRADPPGYPG
jgi:hypothetical protein